MWRRHGTVYGTRAKVKQSAADPYLLLREQVGKEQRQELFSFAAAGMLQVRARPPACLPACLLPPGAPVPAPAARWAQ
jgi:hypothetical protein